jgi:hypothetical protein
VLESQSLRQVPVGDFFVPEKGFKISEEAISRISSSKRTEMGGSTVDCVENEVIFGVRIPISIGDFFSVFVPARVAAKIAHGELVCEAGFCH